MVSPMRLGRVKLGLSQIDLWMQTGIPQWRISLRLSFRFDVSGIASKIMTTENG